MKREDKIKCEKNNLSCKMKFSDSVSTLDFGPPLKIGNSRVEIPN